LKFQECLGISGIFRSQQIECQLRGLAKTTNFQVYFFSDFN
jgi:hypothetical protein